MNPDEGLHLASRFLLAGYPHVVATLWPIADRAAPQVAARFYAELLADVGTVPARALDRAVRSLRATCPDRPSLWAPYIHVGR
ncbi:CHAT domain-containing protein [Streptomyces chiangmaiensis]